MVDEGLSPRVRGVLPCAPGRPYVVGVYPRVCGGCCVIASKNDIYNRKNLRHNLQRYDPTYHES